MRRNNKVDCDALCVPSAAAQQRERSRARARIFAVQRDRSERRSEEQVDLDELLAARERCGRRPRKRTSFEEYTEDIHGVRRRSSSSSLLRLVFVVAAKQFLLVVRERCDDLLHRSAEPRCVFVLELHWHDDLSVILRHDDNLLKLYSFNNKVLNL